MNYFNDWTAYELNTNPNIDILDAILNEIEPEHTKLIQILNNIQPIGKFTISVTFKENTSFDHYQPCCNVIFTILTETSTIQQKYIITTLTQISLDAIF